MDPLDQAISIVRSNAEDDDFLQSLKKELDAAIKACQLKQLTAKYRQLLQGLLNHADFSALRDKVLNVECCDYEYGRADYHVHSGTILMVTTCNSSFRVGKWFGDDIFTLTVDGDVFEEDSTDTPYDPDWDDIFTPLSTPLGVSNTVLYRFIVDLLWSG